MFTFYIAINVFEEKASSYPCTMTEGTMTVLHLQIVQEGLGAIKKKQEIKCAYLSDSVKIVDF